MNSKLTTAQVSRLRQIAGIDAANVGRNNNGANTAKVLLALGLIEMSLVGAAVIYRCTEAGLAAI